MFGIGDAIGSFFDSVFGFLGDILMTVIEWLVKYLVAPIVSAVLEFYKCVICNAFYNISIFILRMIDFIEMLFRSLADLPAKDMAGFKLELSLNGQTGNILLQVLKSGTVQMAFLSMCIVGVFLIVVMTAFQIIKVEYTTEGAKNAKGPIFQKAFRGVSLLLLTPLLVVFGVVFSNQLLNLLDIATKANASSTISGQIFVTSATDAHYLEGELKYEFGEGSNGIIARQIQTQLYGILALIDSLGSSIQDLFGDPQTATAYERGEAERNSIDNGFASQTTGYKYYLMSDVSKYYKYTEINYILLILSGSLIIKTLCFACFGLVIRLYKVAVLFIISPAIIGMSVVNEKALGNWRKAFIGQVLAAYGVVIAINLFFIIVSVLLTIELKFTPAGGGDANSFGILSNTMMTQLLRAIMVISGCVLIEKFSKEIGQFFGADDLLAPGKELAKKGLDTLKKVAMEVAAIAASIYTGGAGGAAIKAGAAAAKGAAKGIAKKVGQNAAKKAANKAGKKGVEKAGKKAAEGAKKKASEGAKKSGQKKPDSKDKKPDTGDSKKEEKPKDEKAESPEKDETKQEGAEENAPDEAKDEAQQEGGEEQQEQGAEQEQPQEQQSEAESGKQSEKQPEEQGVKAEDGNDESSEDDEGSKEDDESSDEEGEGSGDESDDNSDDDVEEELDEDDEFMDDVLDEVSDRRFMNYGDKGKVDNFINGVFEVYTENGGKLKKEDFARRMSKKFKKRANDARATKTANEQGTIRGAIKSSFRAARSNVARTNMNMASLVYGFAQGSRLFGIVNRHSDLVKKGAGNLGSDTFGQAYENAKYKRGQRTQRRAERLFDGSLKAYESGGAIEFSNQVIKKAEVELSRLPLIGEQILNRNRNAYGQLSDRDQITLILSTIEQLKSAGIIMEYDQVLNKLQSSGDIKLTASEIGSNLNLDKLRNIISYAYVNNGRVNQTELAQIFADAIQDQVGDMGNVEMAALMIKLVNETWNETQ